MKPEPATLISFRMHSDVLRAFKEHCGSYQASMNIALREFAIERGWLSDTPDRPPAKRGRPRKLDAADKDT